MDEENIKKTSDEIIDILYEILNNIEKNKPTKVPGFVLIFSAIQYYIEHRLNEVINDNNDDLEKKDILEELKLLGKKMSKEMLELLELNEK